MIYLVTAEQKLFESDLYKVISVQKSLDLLSKFEDNIIQFDTETKGRDQHLGKLLTAQFGNKDKSIQIVVDCTTINIVLYKEVIENALLIGQNLKFDLPWLYNYGIIPLRVYDTMIVEQLLYLGYPPMGKPGGISYALNHIAERRLGVNIDKTVRGQIIWRGLDEEVIIYAANDVVHLCDIASKQMIDARRLKCTKAVKIECDFVPVIAYLEWCGIKLDVNKWKAKMAKDEAVRQEKLEELNQFVVDFYKEHQGKDETIVIQHRVDGIEDNINFESFKSRACSAVYKNEEGINVQDYIIPFYTFTESGKKKIPYVKVDLQGDLFSGFNTGVQCAINWGSSKQTIYFFKILGFNTKTEDKETGEEKDSALEKVLSKQKGINDDFLKLYFDYTAADKLCTTYGQNYLNAINPRTGRIHTNFKQLGASSGRMSCGSKQTNTDLEALKHSELMHFPVKKRKCGYPQLQNLPHDKETRACFIAEAGNLMTSCDYAALESRLGADIYNEQSMIDEYLHGSGDIHSLTAKHCFPVELDGIDVKDIKHLRPDLRTKAKPVEFSQQFGGSAKAIQNSLGCSFEEAKAIAQNYNEGFSGIAKFKEKGFEAAKRLGYVLICKATGHRTYLQGWKEWVKMQNDDDFWEEYEAAKHSLKWEDFKETEIYKTASEARRGSSKWSRLALNAPTQGSGIIILKVAMTNFFHWIIENKYFKIIKICDLIHDESVIEYPKTMEFVADKLKYFMEEASSKYCHKLPIPAEAETGLFWIH